MDLSTSFFTLWTLIVAMCVLAQANPINFRHHAKRHRFAEVNRILQLLGSRLRFLRLPHVSTHVTPIAPTSDVTASENNTNKRELQPERSTVIMKTSKSAERSTSTTASASGSSSAVAGPPTKKAERPGQADRMSAFKRLLRHNLGLRASRHHRGHHKGQVHHRLQLTHGPYEFLG